MSFEQSFKGTDYNPEKNAAPRKVAIEDKINEKLSTVSNGAINEIKVQSDDAEKKKRKRRRKNKNKNKLQENNVPQEMPKPQPKKIAQLNVPSQAKVTKFSDTDEEDSMNDTPENGDHVVKKSDSVNSNMSIGKQVYVDKEKKNEKPPKRLGNIHDEDVDSSTLSQETSSSTGKSFSEALIFALTSPQYGKRFFIDVPIQYMKNTSSEHGKNMMCTQIVFCFYIQNNFCTQRVLMF